MFIGHYAVGFAAKRAAPGASLGVLIAAAGLADLLFPVFTLAGWEQVRIEPGATAVAPFAFIYPLSHSLLTGVGWAVLFAALYWVWTRYMAGAVTIALAVVSHWLLDLVTHRPDLPLYPGGTTLAGLGLWNSVAGTVAVEGLLFVAGVWVYAAMTRPRDRTGRYAFWSFVALLVVLYAASLLGPSPPSMTAMAVVGLLAWLFVFWAAWFDRHRAEK
jgi:membrane-bound metal-dependent hydrolase YbcI (DUF457 family)